MSLQFGVEPHSSLSWGVCGRLQVGNTFYGHRESEITNNSKCASLAFLWLSFLSPHHTFSACSLKFYKPYLTQRKYSGGPWNVLRKVVIWQEGFDLNRFDED